MLPRLAPSSLYVLVAISHELCRMFRKHLLMSKLNVGFTILHSLPQTQTEERVFWLTLTHSRMREGARGLESVLTFWQLIRHGSGRALNATTVSLNCSWSQRLQQAQAGRDGPFPQMNASS